MPKVTGTSANALALGLCLVPTLALAVSAYMASLILDPQKRADVFRGSSSDQLSQGSIAYDDLTVASRTMPEGVFGTYEIARGVLITGYVGFADGRNGRSINQQQISIRERDRVRCMQVGTTHCIDLPLNRMEQDAIRKFVQSEGYIALSMWSNRALSSEEEALREEIFGRPEIARQSRQYGQQRADKVKQALIGLGLVSYRSDPRFMIHPSLVPFAEDLIELDTVGFDWRAAEDQEILFALRALYNGNSPRPIGADATRGRVIDKSHIVVDLAPFVIDATASQFTCIGGPFKVPWQDRRGYDRIYVLRSDVRVMLTRHESLALSESQKRVQDIYCLAALFRTVGG